MEQLPFIGRKSEIELLEEEYRNGGGFVVVYGRRRVGKTTLIKQFIQGKRTIYFLAAKEDDAINRRRFAAAAASATGNELLAQAVFDDWRMLFQAVVDSVGDESLVVAIDEFPYLVSANKAMPSIMQYAWDEIFRNANITLILCGSSLSMMNDAVLSRESPLYGRRTAQIKLKPLVFSDLLAAYPSTSFEDVLELYALSGGVPKYLEFFRPGKSIERSLRRNVFSTTGFLYQEPLFLLGEESAGSASYLSLLIAIAQGNRKLSQIASFVGEQSAGITPYLKTLADLGIVERTVPFHEKYPARSKNGLYRLSDSFMRFWFRYVQPFLGELEMGNCEPSLEAMRRTYKSNYLPFTFEDVCREQLGELCTTGQLAFSPSRIGSYWNRSGSIEIDVCAIDNSNERVFLGECKYHERRSVSLSEYEDLVCKAQSAPNPFDTEPLFGMFSHTGFDENLQRIASQSDNLVLVDKGHLVG